MEDTGFVVLGAGLPRTGTMSTRAALKILLNGDVYHMATVMGERPDHHPLWRKAIAGKASDDDFHSILKDYRGGVDYPVSFYYKEIFKAYPNAKVILNVRDPKRWHQSVDNSIRKFVATAMSWPCTWFLRFTGKYSAVKLTSQLSDVVPTCSSSGLGMFSAVGEGEEAAVKFFNEHVEEVKSIIPPENLLVWEVKQGWGPLCNFLGVPVPDVPFPNVNDTAEIESARKKIKRISYLFVVGIPGAIGAAAWYFNLREPTQFMGIAAGYLLSLGLMKQVIFGFLHKQLQN
eukprot:TRINITY_DN7605_c0_g2_i1.p1 TRINITY_DN7605_c0_g2~~TRINITY_DN7605_c0_g2_i1.p1  ORF type:complete len:298 (+),score=68.23 TRINITY_DN7605_c0_g2_i1:33-896(+)